MASKYIYTLGKKKTASAQVS